ncbi:HypC/HybG/HupF family hydrogenase formation chaperone [Roseibium sediminis]|uniref:HypC/HybG/HupF family hydrogenase formation chaperone n=1 Tax=Roseibium sediminis TaxID=1775174 RepID=UPI00123CC80C|nr:HypC/HybG/HupF family hydrogenase formation chaperone [Roseibium sediminis]
MCVGIPMQVLSTDFGFARCKAEDGEHDVDVRLVGEVKPGTWILVFLGAAREVLDDQTAARISDALAALQSVMQGETNVDRFFEDLIDAKE